MATNCLVYLCMGKNRRFNSFCCLIFLFAIAFFKLKENNLFLVCHTFMLFIRCESAVIQKVTFRRVFFFSTSSRRLHFTPLFQYNEHFFERIHQNFRRFGFYIKTVFKCIRSPNTDNNLLLCNFPNKINWSLIRLLKNAHIFFGN